MYKIGIIGRRDTVQGFMALGFSVHEAADAQQAAHELHAMARTGEYAVIFLTAFRIKPSSLFSIPSDALRQRPQCCGL